MPPTVFYEVGSAQPEAVEEMVQTYVHTLLTIQEIEPIPMRMQNGGDYNDVQVLKPELDPGRSGHALHQRAPVFVSNTWLGVEGNYTTRHIPPTSRDQGPA